MAAPQKEAPKTEVKADVKPLEGKELEDQMAREAEAKKKQEAEEKVKKEKGMTPIIRGRMPVAIVSMVRFGNNKNDKSPALAQLFGTTVGKIDDVKKNRNFAYVDATFKPTQAMKDEGIAWLKKHPKYDAGAVDTLITELEKTTVATDEEAAAFAAKRTASHGQPTTKKDGTTANGGGGNRVGKAAKEKAAAAAGSTASGDAAAAKPAASAEDLLK